MPDKEQIIKAGVRVVATGSGLVAAGPVGAAGGLAAAEGAIRGVDKIRESRKSDGDSEES